MASYPTRPGTERPRRADAQRNYERLVEQARLVFAEAGVDASLDEIARRAGVASGTLYRHFPTRRGLMEAVLADQVGELVALGRRSLAATDVGELDSLSTWLRAAIAHGMTYRGLAAAVMNSALDAGESQASTWHEEMFEVGAALLDRARRAGTVVACADPADIFKLIGAIAWADPGGPSQAERLVDLIINGLRSRDTEP